MTVMATGAVTVRVKVRTSMRYEFLHRLESRIDVDIDSVSHNKKSGVWTYGLISRAFPEEWRFQEVMPTFQKNRDGFDHPAEWALVEELPDEDDDDG